METQKIKEQEGSSTNDDSTKEVTSNHKEIAAENAKKEWVVSLHLYSSSVISLISVSLTIDFQKMYSQLTIIQKVELLKTPLSKEEGTLQLTIIRKKGIMNKLWPKYCLYNSKGNSFLMNAKKSFGTKTPYYTVTADNDNFDKNGEGYLGKVRGAADKSMYFLLDNKSIFLFYL